ncbi:MAG: aldehyde dehydrogenase family protein, partial [Myxococcales bacterium]|nr:aldehyde dehydrogenase family protein [Myxococcales bacterium]
PIDGSVYVEREHASAQAIDQTLDAARSAQRGWADASIAERAEACSRLVDRFEQHAVEIAEEVTRQMGRPIAHSPGEVRGLAERSRHMIAIAADALADVGTDERDGFERFIRREPLGLVFTVAPWNYPLLTSVNSIVPALMAGNAVVLKHSAQTPLCAERYSAAARAAGMPEGLLAHVHCSHDDVARIVGDPRVDFVAFTGSVEGGHAIVRAAAERFIGTGLELGGKDPAYVRADADLDHAIENLVDGAFFNAGQSCCGIERIYVHRDVFDAFVDGSVELTRRYVLGNPLDPATTLGPMVRTSAADFVRDQIRAAVDAGARALIDESEFPRSRAGTPYLAPQLLVDVDHSMSVMREESFGPVVGVMAVDDDAQAVERMNDSAFGLTASLWTRDRDAALALGRRIETGTCFMNRCDYLDPALAWVGVKDSGRGCTLSSLGYEWLTRPKSFHFRL